MEESKLEKKGIFYDLIYGFGGPLGKILICSCDNMGLRMTERLGMPVLKSVS